MHTTFQLQLPSPIQQLDIAPWAPQQPIRIAIKRDDLIHSIISGNKARKLHQLIESIKTDKPQHLLTMGGNRSNFLHALGYLCHQEKIKLTAMIRGHQPEQYGKTLQDLQHWNVDLQFIDKLAFQKYRQDKHHAKSLAHSLSALWLPEGGSNANALLGIIKAIDELEEQPDTIFVPIGTGCTALGLALGLKQRGWQTQVIGVVVLKGVDGEDGIAQDIQALATDAGFAFPDNLHLEHRFCDKGFGQQTPALKEQQLYFEKLWDVPLDPVYTVKMCNAFKQYSEENNPLLGNHTLLWHTGGLQGN